MANPFAALNQKPVPVATVTEDDREIGLPVVRVTTRPPGKRSRPDFEKVGLYLHSDRRKRAERKWEDEGQGDFSDLVDKLLTAYLDDQ